MCRAGIGGGYRPASVRAATSAFLRGRQNGKRGGPAMAAPGSFPAATEPPFHREPKEPASAILRCAPALPLRVRVQVRPARRLSSP